MPLPTCQCNAGQPTQTQLANIYCALLEVIAGSGGGFTPPLLPSLGGTGVVNLDAETITLNGGFPLALTLTGPTGLTLPTTGTLATLAGAETLSGKTLTVPRIVGGGFIADENGNEQIVFGTTVGAVNQLQVANAATGNAPLLSVSGSDADISLNLAAKGSGLIVAETGVEAQIGLNVSGGSLIFAAVGVAADPPAPDGTYAVPTSITIANGVITAIS